MSSTTPILSSQSFPTLESTENISVASSPLVLPSSTASPSTSLPSPLSIHTTSTAIPSIDTPVSTYGAIPNVSSTTAFRTLSLELRTLLEPLNTTESKGQIQYLDNSVSAILARLDEFSALIDSMRTNTHMISSTLLPSVLQQSAHLSTIYSKIDSLEEYVNHVEASTTHLENRIQEVEIAYGGIPTVQKFLSFMKRNIGSDSNITNSDDNKEEKSVSSEPIEIVNASDFFNIRSASPNKNEPISTTMAGTISVASPSSSTP